MPNTAVKMLISDVEGDVAKGYDLILRQRAEVVAELVAVIKNPENHRVRPDAVENAMAALGKFRAPEAVTVLVAHIGFPFILPPGGGENNLPGTARTRTGTVSERTVPAVRALIEIGEPSVDAVIKKLATTDHVLEQQACIVVLRHLSKGPSVAQRLESALRKAPAKRRVQLEKGLAEVIKGND